MVEMLSGELEDKEEENDGITIIEGKLSDGTTNKEKTNELAKQTVIEMVNRIPYERILEDEDNRNKPECWNCGMDCKFFRAKGEVTDEEEMFVEEEGTVKKKVVKLKRENNKCKGKTSDTIGSITKRCNEKEVYEEIKTTPDWLDDLDELDDDDIPMTDKQLKDDGRLKETKKGSGVSR